MGPTTLPTSVRFPRPGDFDGTAGKLKQWLNQLELYFWAYGMNGENERIAYAIMLMSEGVAQDWAQAWLYDRTSGRKPYGMYKEFAGDVNNAFADTDELSKARLTLDGMRQERDESVAEFINRFRNQVLLADLHDDNWIGDKFVRAINPGLAKRIFNVENFPTDCQGLYTLAARLERHWRMGQMFFGKQAQQQTKKKTYNSGPSHKNPNFTNIDRMSPEEHAKHFKNGLCFVCHEPGHLARDCVKRQKRTSSYQNKTSYRNRVVAQDQDESEEEGNGKDHSAVDARIHELAKQYVDHKGKGCAWTSRYSDDDYPPFDPDQARSGHYNDKYKGMNKKKIHEVAVEEDSDEELENAIKAMSLKGF